MDIFNKVPISQFIWYLVPGLSLALYILFPTAAFAPQKIIKFFDAVGSFGIIMLAIILGFLADGLRLYRFRPKYRKIKRLFFAELRGKVDLDSDPYSILAAVNDLALESGFTNLGFRHSIWIMLGHLTFINACEAVFWAGYVVYVYGGDGKIYHMFGMDFERCVALTISSALFLLFALITVRVGYICREEQGVTNAMYLSFMGNNKSRLEKKLKEVS